MKIDRINAIELSTDLIGRPITATVMFTSQNAMIADTTLATGPIESADVVEIQGTIMGVESARNGGRAAKIVNVRVHAYNGEFREFRDHEFVWGSHITVVVGDPLADEDSESDAEIIAFGECPDPESDGIMCGVDGCTATAEFVGLDIDGKTSVPVCKIDSYTGRWWGVWPIEDDETYGVPVGGTGEISKIESLRRNEFITHGDYLDHIAVAAHAATVKSTGAVRLWRRPKVSLVRN